METKKNIRIVISNYREFHNAVLDEQNTDISYTENEILRLIKDKIESKYDYYLTLEYSPHDSVIQSIAINSNKVYWFNMTNFITIQNDNEIVVYLNFNGVFEKKAIQDKTCVNCISSISMKYRFDEIPYCGVICESMTRKEFYSKIRACCEYKKNKIIQDKTIY